jgi:hypothetical protein
MRRKLFFFNTDEYHSCMKEKKRSTTVFILAFCKEIYFDDTLQDYILYSDLSSHTIVFSDSNFIRRKVKYELPLQSKLQQPIHFFFRQYVMLSSKGHLNLHVFLELVHDQRWLGISCGHKYKYI